MNPAKRCRTAFVFFVAFLLLVSLCASPAVAGSLLQNGNFIQGTAGWYSSSWIAGAGRWDVEDGVLTIESEAMNDVRLKQDVSLSPGVCYRIRCEIRVESITQEGTASAWAGFDYSPAKAAPQTGSSDWQIIDFYARSGDTQSSATLCLALGDYGNLASGRVQFRNIEIVPEEAPEGYAVLSMEQYISEDDSSDEDVYALGYWSEALNKLLIALLCFVFVYAIWRWGQRCRWLLPGRVELAFAVAALLLGFFIRLGATVVSDGYPIDTSTFASWAERMVDVGPGAFYSQDYFCDYPPGILYLLWFSGEICQALGLVVIRSGPGLAVLFLPIILCDVGLCLLVWRYARSKLKPMHALAILFLMAFHPAIIYDTAVWHQVDAVLALCIAGTFILLEKDKKLWAAAIYGLAVLVKPQALMLGPVFALPYLRAFFGGKNRKKAALNLAGGIAISFGLIILLSLPFTGEQSFWPISGQFPDNWLLSKYVTTASSYPYATVNAHNVYTLFNANFLSQEAMLGPLTFVQWATLAIFVMIIAAVVFYSFATKNGIERKSLSLLAAFLLAGLFTFGPRMHERYSFALLALLPLAYAQLRDKGVLNAFAMYSAGIYANMSLALLALNDMEAYFQTAYIFASKAVALYNILCFAYLTMVCYDICVRKHLYQPRPFFFSFRRAQAVPAGSGQTRNNAPPERSPKQYRPLLHRRTFHQSKELRTLSSRLNQRDHSLHWSRWDSAFIIALTVIYAVIALFHLGTTDVPESYWRGLSGQEIRLRFDEPVQLEEIWSYGGISDGVLQIIHVDSSLTDAATPPQHDSVDAAYITETESAGLTIMAMQNADYDVMYRWTVSDVAFEASELLLRASGNTWLEELIFVDENGQICTPEIVSVSGEAADDKNSSPQHLFDEQSTKPDRPDVTNGMYFDELYHGRTAYEHLHGLKPYENTHPPLGKIFIMLGVAIFGMNPFGWRIVGTIFGIAMVPIFYLLGKRLLKNSKLSAFITILFTFDFMHFAQTRIATIDVYGVFFILLMYYFMLEYWQMNFYADGLKATLRPLALSGLFFGLGAASKWICLYAGAGLAVIFFLSLGMRMGEYLSARSAQKRRLPGADALVAKTRPFARHALCTLLLCVLMFIIVPVAIYIASYTPYLLAREQSYNFASIWEIQQNMFRYHEGLTARHPYESSWWTWPFDARPIYYYQAKRLPEGMSGAISAFGNPIVWWTGLVCLVALIVRGVRRRRFDHTTLFILIGFAAQFLPWSFITRATFIYHYFASVPFILLATGYVFQRWIRRWPGAKKVAIGLTAAALISFAIFYPAISGIPVSTAYLQALRLFPSWTW